MMEMEGECFIAQMVPNKESQVLQKRPSADP